MGRFAVLLLLIAIAASASRAADDDFTDIPDLEPARPTAKPAARPARKPGAKPKPGRAAPAGVAGDLIRRYEAGRHAAFTERVYSLAVCGGNLWGGDSRRGHALVADGDAWLARGDAMYEQARRTGDRKEMPRALRDLAAAHQLYAMARNPPELRFTGEDSPRPRPFPSAYPSEPHPGPGMGQVVPEVKTQWRRHDELPLEVPSRFDDDPHW